MSTCNCIGPQNGASLCPCLMRSPYVERRSPDHELERLFDRLERRLFERFEKKLLELPPPVERSHPIPPDL